MKKLLAMILSLTILLCALAACGKNDEENDTDDTEELGASSETQGDAGQKTVLAKEVHYRSDGSVYTTVEYEYDEIGNVIKKTTYYDEDDWKITEYEYDEHGNQVKFAVYNADGELNQWGESRYDDRGNEIYEISWVDFEGYRDSNVVYENAYTYEYDYGGNVLKCITEDVEYGSKSRDEYNYDGNGNLIMSKKFGENGEVRRWTEYTYDGEGKNTVITGCNSEENVYYSIDLKYDQSKRLVEKRLTCTEPFLMGYSYITDEMPMGGYIQKICFEYDAKGRLVNQLEYDCDGEFYRRYEYEYSTVKIS